MLTIRAEQMRALQEPARDRFAVELQGMALRHWPALKPGEELLRLAHDALERCAAYGMDDKADAARFLNLMLLLGADFDREGDYAWAARYFRDHTMSAASRLRRVSELALEQLAPVEPGTG